MSIPELRTRLDELNVALEKGRALADQQTKEKRKITRLLSVLIYPVLTLPPEIVSLIFGYCIHYPSQVDKPDNWRCPAPLFLLHICRTWRNIGLADSSLWTTLHLWFDEYYMRESNLHFRAPDQIENFLTSWVRRARGHPLVLIIHGDMLGCLGQARSVALLTKVAPQVKVLELSFAESFDWTNPDVSALDPIRWPILEGVHIDPGSTDVDIGDFFAHAPRLREVGDFHGRVFTPAVATLPWKQITLFQGYLRSLQDGIDVLLHCEKLEECEFCLMEDYTDPINTPSTLSHSHLRLLLLKGEDDGLSSTILPFLELPALEDLELTEHPGDPHSVIEFLKCHSLRLKKLQIHHTLVKSLPHMPALVELSLLTVRYTYTTDLSQLLQCERQFLPSLQHIELQGFRSKKREDYQAMALALTAHWNHAKACADVAALRSFDLNIQLDKDELLEDFEELVSPLINLKAEGVDIQVRISGHQVEVGASD